MQLTAAHLRYLLAIYEVSRTHLDISSRSIAEKLGVTKPSVVRILNLLMEQGMIVKEYYGKIYLTDRGIWVAKRVQQELDAILAHFPPVSGERVFEPFFRVDKSRSRELGGVGLGLALVHEIVRVHDGSISIKSNPAGGTIFEVIFDQKSKE